MGYYVRTGRHSGVSLPFWFYAFFIAPFQLALYFFVAMIYLVTVTFIAAGHIIAAVVRAVDVALGRTTRAEGRRAVALRPSRSLTAEQMEAINREYAADVNDMHDRWETENRDYVRKSERKAVDSLYGRPPDEGNGE